MTREDLQAGSPNLAPVGSRRSSRHGLGADTRARDPIRMRAAHPKQRVPQSPCGAVTSEIPFAGLCGMRCSGEPGHVTTVDGAAPTR